MEEEFVPMEEQAVANFRITLSGLLVLNHTFLAAYKYSMQFSTLMHMYHFHVGKQSGSILLLDHYVLHWLFSYSYY